jgi:hypothetical protein
MRFWLGRRRGCSRARVAGPRNVGRLTLIERLVRVVPRARRGGCRTRIRVIRSGGCVCSPGTGCAGLARSTRVRRHRRSGLAGSSRPELRVRVGWRLRSCRCLAGHRWRRTRRSVVGCTRARWILTRTARGRSRRIHGRTRRGCVTGICRTRLLQQGDQLRVRLRRSAFTRGALRLLIGRWRPLVHWPRVVVHGSGGRCPMIAACAYLARSRHFEGTGGVAGHIIRSTASLSAGRTGNFYFVAHSILQSRLAADQVIDRSIVIGKCVIAG